MKSEQEFRTYFDSNLLEQLKPLEDIRKQGIKESKKYRHLSIWFIIVSIVPAFFEFYYPILVGVILLIYFGSQSMEVESKMQKLLRKEFKNKIIPSILNFLYSEFEYIPNQKLAKSVFEKSLLFPSEIYIVDGEDFMRFWFDNVNIMFCESIVYGYSPQSIIFSGIFISATFNKSFTSQTFIFPKKQTSFWRKLKFKILGSEYIIKLEDPEFEKEFIVLSTDQVESRYILTPNLMQRILEYKRKIKCDISFSFVKNRLYCTIPNFKDLFEPRLDATLLDYDFIMESYIPIKLYTSLVQDLNLNMRIWSKE